MSIVRVALVLFLASQSQASGQNCALSGTPAWSEQLRTVIADCDNRLAAPNGRLTLLINAAGQVKVASGITENVVQLTARGVSPPAMASWSPISNAFFINDGEGSGMSSTFRLFRVEHTQIVEDATVEKEAVLLYRKQAQCSSSTADPNVWGIGWSSDGELFYLLVQATVDDPCGKPGAFIGMTVKLTDSSVVKTLSERSTERIFRTLLPPEIYTK
jgi:hypothetical protein